MIPTSCHLALISTPLFPPDLQNSKQSLNLRHRKRCRSRGRSGNLLLLKTLKMVRGRSSDLHLCRVLEGSEAAADDEDVCPVDCVREFKTDEEFLAILDRARETGALVVVDFYRTSCGSCKYIEQGFAKLCKGSGDQQAPVLFLKHNVIDEYDEQSEVADRLRIKAVPLFHFYKNGVLLEAFPTRDKDRILAAIQKYTSPS